MALSKKLRSNSGIFAAVLAFGLVAYVLWQPSQAVDGEMPLQSSPLSAGEPPELEPHDLEPHDLEPRGVDPHTTLPSSRPRGDVETFDKLKRTTSQVTVAHDVALDSYKSGLWDEIQAHPPEFRQPGDPALDADTAYRLYMYFGNCSVLLSRGNRQIEKIASRAETAGERSLEDLEGRLDRLVDYYELCQPISPDVDSRMEAVIWMSEAVRLGHEIAEIQFYQKAMGFIMRPDPSTNSPPLAMKHPGLVADFKITSRLGLTRALEKGHPEAYLAKSQAILEGLLYPKDPALALVYARKAEIEAAKNHLILREIGRWKKEATKYLSQEQIAEAGQRALELESP